MIVLLAAAIAYVLGAIPFGYLLVKWTTGRDVRSGGSGNIGATNVLRTTGRAAGIATLLLDIGKGYLAVWIAGRLSNQSVMAMCVAALAVMAGHAYPGVSCTSKEASRRQLRGRVSLPHAAGAGRGAGGVCGGGGVDASHLHGVGGERGDFSAGGVADAEGFDHASVPPLIAGAFIIYKHSSNIRRLHAGSEHVFTFGAPQVLKNLAIIGAGSWGTALAIVLAPRFRAVRLWVYETDLAARMRVSRENDVYLPGFQLAEPRGSYERSANALEGADVVLSVMPSHLVRRLYQQMLPPCTSRCCS
jgi:acyl phosphate:glycerol-3-phosphate acyltransferase